MDIETNKSESITNTYNLLKLIISDPKQSENIDESILSDQKRLAQLDLPKVKIVPMSLNRWKHYADEVLPIGWKGLDGLRKDALKSVKKAKDTENKPSRGSKKDIEDRLEKEKNTSQSYLNEIERFSEQYKHLLEICHIQGRNDPDFKIIFNRHLERYAHNRTEWTVISSKGVSGE